MKGKKGHLTGVSAILAIVLGVLCPLCFIAPLLLAAGFGSVLVTVVPWLKPLLVVVIITALIGLGISFKVHRNFLPVVLTLIAGGLMYYGNYISYNPNITYLGGFLIIVAIGSDWWLRRQVNNCLTCRVDFRHHKLT
ncbi:MerC domain-containing protein [Candidatus Gottesmanbacteria bacterium]|nr:MerC domain-containing protein [Candidatus Gottesmanbacteria bacterium]